VNNSSLPLLTVIAGPTASGKTALSLLLAEKFNGEILSADARQFYRGMDIGTAKPTPDELARVRHHFVNSLEVEQPYTAGDFEREALECLQEVFQRKKRAFLVGGSGLFIKAVCEGLDEFPAVNQEIRDHLRELLAAEGIPALQARLQRLDPVFFSQVDKENPRRLLRALEVCMATGQPFSSFHHHQPRQRPFQILKIGLLPERQELYARIDQRVAGMMDSGLEEEARRFYPKRQLNALQTVGYTELFEYFDGKMNLEQAVGKIRQHTRNYAKRQITWFKKDPAIHWFQNGTMPEVVELMEQSI